MSTFKIFLSILLSFAIWIFPAQTSIDGIKDEYRQQIRSLMGYSFVVLIPENAYQTKKGSIDKFAAQQKALLVGHLPLLNSVAFAFRSESKGYHLLAMQDSACRVLSRREYISGLDYLFKQRAFAWCIIMFVTTFVMARLMLSLYP